MFFTDKNAVQCYKKHKTGFMLGILSAIAAVGVLAFLYCYTSYKLKNAVSMQDAYILNSQNYVPNRIAYIDTEEELIGIGMYGNTELYDVVHATDGYLYMLYLNAVEEININRSVRETGKARIYGVTADFKTDWAREFALEDIREAAQDYTIGSDAINEWFGYMQLNVAEPNPLSLMTESSILYGLSILLFIVLAVYFISSNYPRLKKWKTVGREEAAELDEEVSRDIAAWMPNLQLYAGDEHIISFARGAQALPYSDILMIFEYSCIKDVKFSDEIKILDKHGIVHTIADIPVLPFDAAKISDMKYELKYLGETAKTKNGNIHIGQDNAKKGYNEDLFYDLLKRAKSGEFK